MPLILLSFIAGVLTILAPCVLPLLPVIIGGSLSSKNKWRPYLVILGLIISISVFTLLLKATTLLIDIDPQIWVNISGGIIFIFGLIYLFPQFWDSISLKLNLSGNSDKLLENAGKKEGVLGAILVGASLGPVFASCSPTYSLIIATILPVSLVEGLLYIFVYSLGLAMVMLLITLLGRSIVVKLKVFANPNGWFKKILGVLFILVAISVVTGFDKKISTNLLNTPNFFDVTNIEKRLLEDKFEQKKNQNKPNNSQLPMLGKSPEIQGTSGWINSSPLKLSDLKGKVVLIDFWTYSCINCQRTIPYLNKWYDTYKDKDFVIIGVHAPEFSFEKKIENVQKSVTNFGIKYPITLDNEFSTWNAYKNQFWPAKYLIDKDGNIRYTHFGEGKYDETEEAIKSLLSEETGQSDLVSANIKTETASGKFCTEGKCYVQSPETYFGSTRLENLINKDQIKVNESKDYNFTNSLQNNTWSLNGKWLVQDEKIVSNSKNGENSKLNFKFNGKKVYLVAGSTEAKDIQITIDGKTQYLGSDVNEKGIATIKDEKLYNIVSSSEFLIGQNLQIEVPNGVVLFVFTFG